MTHELDIRLADWEARLDRLERKPLRAKADGTNLLFAPSPSGYALVEREGHPPAVGKLVELEGRGGRYGVLRVVRSPLPGDERSCAYLQLIEFGRRSPRSRS